MKKAFALVLTIALIAALAVVSFAASPVGSQEDILTGLYVSGKDYDTAVYSLVVTWDAENTFSWIPNKATWNPDVQQYVGDGTGVWADESFTVSVVNHSNKAVNASVAVKNYMDGVTVAVDGESKCDLAAATEGSAYEAAPFISFDLVASGVPASADLDGKKVATATLTLSKVNA